MKKFLVVLMIVALVMVFATSAFAAGHHPPHAEGEAGKANENAKPGLHTAKDYVANANGRAAHVLKNWVGPHAPQD